MLRGSSIEASAKTMSGSAFRRIIRMYTNGRLRSVGTGEAEKLLIKKHTKGIVLTTI